MAKVTKPVNVVLIMFVSGLILASCAHKLPVKEVDQLYSKVETVAKKLAEKTLQEIDKFSIRHKQYLTTVTVEDKDWEKNGKWNRLSQEFYEDFSSNLTGITKISPFYDFGRLVGGKRKYGKYTKPDLNIFLEIRLDKSLLIAKAYCEQSQSDIEIDGFPVESTTNLNNTEISSAKLWLKEKEDAPPPSGEPERPFIRRGDAAAFLAKIVCGSISEAIEKYPQLVPPNPGNNKTIPFVVSKFSTKEKNIPGIVLKDLNEQFGYFLGENCEQMTQSLSRDNIEIYIHERKNQQQEIFRYDPKQEGIKIEPGSVVFLGNVSSNSDNDRVFSARITAYWLSREEWDDNRTLEGTSTPSQKF